MNKVAVCTLVAALAAPSAIAQENPFLRGRYIAVPERQQPEFDPEPLRAGAFLVNSSLGVGAEYNDNIYAQDISPTEDVILTINPRADIVSNWSSHALGAGIDVNHREYNDQGTESVTDYNAYVNGRLDVTRNVQLGGRVYGGRLSEQRYAPSQVNNAAEPTRFDRFGAEAYNTFRRDRIQLETTAGFIQNDYDSVPLVPDPANPGGPTVLNQDFRDVEETFLRSRASYAISPDFAVFVQAEGREYIYDLAVDPSGLSRDSMHLNGQVGASFELASPFRGDIAVGYISENKYDPALDNTDGLSVNGNLEWFPTQITTVTFTGLRTIFDPGLIGSSSAIVTNFGARVDHELRRNVIAFGTLNNGTTEFKGLVPGATPGSLVAYDREDDIFDVGAGLGYKLNKNARVDASYVFRTQDSSGVNADRDFDQNIVRVELRLFP